MKKGEQIALAFLGVVAVSALIFGVGKAMAGPKDESGVRTDSTGKKMYLHPDGVWRETPPVGTGKDWTGGGTDPNTGGGFDPTEYIGDPCKRWCDIKHMFNPTKRKACKADCVDRG